MATARQLLVHPSAATLDARPRYRSQRTVGSGCDAPLASGRVEHVLPLVLRDARAGRVLERWSIGQRPARLPRHGHEACRRPASGRSRPRLRPRLAPDGARRHLRRVQGRASRRARRPDDPVRDAPGDPGPHRDAPGPDGELGGRGRHRRVLPRGHRGRPHRDRERRS